MKLNFFNIFLLLFAAVACGSCSSEGGIDLPDEPDPASPLLPEVYLNLNVGVLPQSAASRSRAYEVDDDNYFEAPEFKYERMNTLRVIIVRGSRITPIDALPDSAGYVEHNQLFKFNELGLVQFDNMTFKVRSGENKKIYLIANEAFIKSRNGIDFDDLKVAEKCTENFIENIILKAEAGQPLIDNTGDNPFYIPMSEEFDMDIPIPENPLDYQIDKSFFITRAAVKFSFTINCTGSDNSFYLKGITVNSLADREYLLPNTAVYDPETGLLANGENVPSSSPAPDVAGHFTTTYNVPENLDYKSYTFDFGKTYPITKTATLISPQIYFCESKLGYDYNADLTTVLDPKKRPYTVNITIAHTETDDEGNETLVESTLGPAYLPNLPTLPRNTHVKVDMTLTGTYLSATVELVPYISVTLDPLFGFTQPYPPYSRD